MFLKAIKKFSDKIEIALAVIFFCTMILSCGRYIDIKINGKSSVLQRLPENEKTLLLRASQSQQWESSNPFIKPTFAGICTKESGKVSAFSLSARKVLLEDANEVIVKCFSGSYETLVFKSKQHRLEYIESLKNAPEYMLFGFMNDIPASAFLPSFAKNYEPLVTAGNFYVKYMFLVPDEKSGAYIVTVSEDLNVRILKSDEQVQFNINDYSAYNENTDFVPFSYAKSECIVPLIEKTVAVNDFCVDTAANVYGKSTDTQWVQKFLDVFNINKSLSKVYITKDNSVLDYIDDTNEMLFSSDGTVTYDGSEKGIYLEHFLGYYPQQSSFSVSDKILSVKQCVNMMEKSFDTGDASVGISKIYYEPDTDKLFVDVKYFVGGIVVTDREYDGRFVINGDYLVNAEFFALSVTALETSTYLIPQKYALSLSGEQTSGIYAALSKKDENVHSAMWKYESTQNGEVDA